MRLFCGALLMCVYCRARWGDLMRTEHVVVDTDNSGQLQFLEARTGRHKTMRAQMHRHQFLPMVAPCHGIDGKDWGSVWVQVRDSLHVSWPPEGLIMPALKHRSPVDLSKRRSVQRGCVNLSGAKNLLLNVEFRAIH